MSLGIPTTQGLMFLTGGLHEMGQNHALYTFLFEDRKHHVVFRKNNRDNLLETVHF